MTLDPVQNSILQTLAAKMGPAAEFAARDACAKMGTRPEALTPAQADQFITALQSDLGRVLSAKDVQELIAELKKIR
jgi:hypothetical protein